jgi:hypothetical protein
MGYYLAIPFHSRTRTACTYKAVRRVIISFFVNFFSLHSDFSTNWRLVPPYPQCPFMVSSHSWQSDRDGNWGIRVGELNTKQNKTNTPTHPHTSAFSPTHVHHHPATVSKLFFLHSCSSLLRASRRTDSGKSLESQQIGTPPGVADLVLCCPFFVIVCTLHYFLTCSRTNLVSSQVVLWLVSLFGSFKVASTSRLQWFTWYPILAIITYNLRICPRVDASLDTLLSRDSLLTSTVELLDGMLRRNLMELFRDLNELCQGQVTAP